MADFNNLREQAKQWLSSMFVPKELSPEGIANTGAGATGMALGAVTQPGVVPAMYMLDKLLKTNAGKQIQTMLDATGPMGGGLDDIVVAGAKTAPAALGMVAPLVGNLGRMKPRGVPAKPSEWFHSNLAEAVDKAWLAEGKPSDLLNIKQVKAWLNKLPGMGVKKEEIKHFDLNQQLQDLTDLGESKFTKQQLANIVDRKMPNIVRLGDTANPYKQYTLPDGSNYDVQLLASKDIYAPGPYGAEKINPMTDINATYKGHWPKVPEDTSNILQHIRTTDRVLPDGRKALYAEEVQSDWQQQHPETYPLVQNYEDLAHKYLYRKAADEGYDSVAWTPASVHIQRWGGEKKPDSMRPQYEYLHQLPEQHPFRKEYIDNYNTLVAGHKAAKEQLRKELLAQNTPADIINRELRDLNINHIDEIDNFNLDYNQRLKDIDNVLTKHDKRFSGFESFYNKRMVDSATGMLKRMGGGKVSETDLEPIQPDIMRRIIGTGPGGVGRRYDKELPPSQEPIDFILDKYRNEFNPDAGFIQPSPNKSFVYDIKPEDKNITPQYKSLQDQLKDEKDPAKRTELRRILMTQGDTNPPEINPWSAPMAGKTVPLWMLLSGIAFDQLRGDKK